ncbi:hypothetical protein BGW36DRAFT_459086 [Talaromyces proteolyticus]|uniref:Zn(2)-C6 fungal-type domain-containing protein n=1 Tax=Talaromyces proteolyticus TaxID=1131652 RepID=A0AAD4PZ92_9EURO|nr:uncharacterized protein BGW36DRAFT_459086 [Talaromyces proteolyticus]KAH8702380.1 hypothetical protein BGW36DRAFT_459086 [Talaromyces proteolyticus]
MSNSMDDSTARLFGEPGKKPSQKNACAACARRKIKCNRQDPCSNCVKSNTVCSFALRTAPSRSRKRLVSQEDLYARLHRYEDLLRKHNIDISLPDNWIHATIKQQDDSSYTVETTSSDTSNASKPAHGQQNWWAELSDELKNPTEQQVPLPQVLGNLSSTYESPYESPVPASPTTTSLLFGSRLESRKLMSHPSPNIVFKIWQYFLDNINILIRIIHGPTMQQDILKAIDNPQDMDNAQEALMFSIYTLVVTSMSAADCLAMLAYEKAHLLAQFRNAAQQALTNANFTSTMDFKVLQALVLYMLSDPDSEETFILSTVAVRISQRLGVTGKDDPKVSVFENEMRLRLWWQLIFLDARAAMARPNVGASLTVAELDKLRLPKNVNDSELYPEMSEPPSEYGRFTDMVLCIMKYDCNSIIRLSKHIPPHARSLRIWSDFYMALAEKDEIIDTVAEHYQKKYLQYCDPKVPLQNYAIIMGNFAISRMKFRAHHPRNNPDWSTPEEIEIMFFHSVRLLEYDNCLRKTKLPQQLVKHLTSKIQIDILICILTGLRRRATGELVENAWKQIEIFYADHTLLVEDTKNTLYMAVGDLALKAWKTRISSSRLHTTPEFILKLLHQRNSMHNSATESHFSPTNLTNGPSLITNETQNKVASSSTPLSMGISLDTPDVDWSFWDGLLSEPSLGGYGQEILGYNIAL